MFVCLGVACTQYDEYESYLVGRGAHFTIIPVFLCICDTMLPARVLGDSRDTNSPMFFFFLLVDLEIALSPVSWPVPVMTSLVAYLVVVGCLRFCLISLLWRGFL